MRTCLMRKVFPVFTMIGALVALFYLLHSFVTFSSLAELLRRQPRAALVPAIMALLIAYIWVITIRLSVERTARTLRQQVEEQRRQRELAEAGNRAKGELLAHMSHEIRTPMNAILGFTELALKSDLSSELRGYLDTVRTSAKWLMHVINDIFDFSCLEAGRLELKKDEVSIAACIRSAVDMVETQAVEKKLELKYKIDPQIPPKLVGDRERLEQIVVNLLDNAVKFTSTGSVLVWAALESESQDTATIRISIADTGMGIPPERQQSLFEPFSACGDSSLASRDIGIGLAICRKLAELMGGSIEVQSQIGAGSTFSFRVSLQKASATSEQIEPRANRPESLSILVAEDNATNRRLLTRVLQSAGHRVSEAANGEEAVRAFQSEHFDVVLMDLSMPHVDGLEAVRRIRLSEAKDHHVTILATTAHTMPGDRQNCLDAGMDGYISKPLQADELLNMIAALAPSQQRNAEKTIPPDKQPISP